MKKLKRIVCMMTLCFMITLGGVDAIEQEASNTEQILQEQQEQLGVSDFIELSEKYTENNLKDVNIKEIFASAMTGKVGNTHLWNNLLNIFGSEFKTAISSIRNHSHYHHFT